MHQTHLFKNILNYLQDQERSSKKNIAKIHILLSEFGGLSEEHFREHYRQLAGGTKWEHLDIEIKKIPYGPELEITRIDFA